MKKNFGLLVFLSLTGFVTSFGSYIVAANLPAYSRQTGAGLIVIGILIALYDVAEIMAKLNFNDPAVPIIGNTTAKPLTTAGEVKEELLAQLCNCVQWQRSIEYMVSDGVANFIEIGPGRVLAGLIKRIDRSVNIINVGTAEAVKNLA